ncbi:ABC transporter [Halobellus salinus]|uniref:ABC transporter n=1 Tax=Halobellus salinus TaxID=931585 RepID=A0A830EE79_9EURY|nr:ABC transporter permease [Halobellus salinus]GGJ16953.1 ABC transporter [Halobellus salinus]SMP34379.1 peptide/nickel transport system permease protein [Halobellus salinus]
MKITDFHLYLLKRLSYLVLTMFLVSAIVFASTIILPGNAAVLILGRSADENSVAALEKKLGLDQPWYEQYFDWVGGLFTGDAGTSLVRQEPVIDIVVPRLFTSLQLAVFTLLVVMVIGISAGVLSALKRDTIVDRIISGVAYVGVSLPEFVTGTLLILLLAGPVFNVFPASGFVPLSEGIVPYLSHMILPVATLTLLITAYVLRQTRTEIIEVLQSDYVRTARLKGVSRRRVLYKHVLRNGLLPTITVLALNFGWMMGSLVVVEEIFAISGLGRLVVFAIQNRDLPLLQFVVLVIAGAYAFANLGADLLYGYLDPRISYGGEE